MRKLLTLGLTLTTTFVCAEIATMPSGISEKVDRSVAKLSGELNKKIGSDLAEADKVSDNVKTLNAKIEELLNSKYILEKENSSLRDQVHKLQKNCMDGEDEIDSLNIKILNMEREKEELLQKLFDQHVSIQEEKAVSFELNSLLNQIPTEDEITKDCIKLLQDLDDMDVRVNQILSNAESLTLDLDKVGRIEKIIEDLKVMQESVQKKVEFYKKHEQKLMELCNKEKYKLPNKLEQLKKELIEEQNKFSSMQNLKIEENLMNSIYTIKAFRQSQSAEQAEQLNLFEKKLHEYAGLKIKESDLHRLENKTKDFSDNIAKIEMMSLKFIKNNDRLESMKNNILKMVERTKAVNDNKQ